MNQHASISRFHKISFTKSTWQWDGSNLRFLCWTRELGRSSFNILRNSSSQIQSRNLAHDNLISGYNSKAWKRKFRYQCQRSRWIARFDCNEVQSETSQYTLDWFTCLSRGQDLTDRINLLLEVLDCEGSIVLRKLKGWDALRMPQTYGNHSSVRPKGMPEQVPDVCLRQCNHYTLAEPVARKINCRKIASSWFIACSRVTLLQVVNCADRSLRTILLWDLACIETERLGVRIFFDTYTLQSFRFFFHRRRKPPTIQLSLNHLNKAIEHLLEFYKCINNEINEPPIRSVCKMESILVAFMTEPVIETEVAASLSPVRLGHYRLRR